MQSLDELDHVCTHYFFARSIVVTDFVCDAGFVIAPLHQFEDLGPDDIQGKHLTVMDIQQNSAIYRFGASDRVRYFQHTAKSQMDWASGGEDFGT